MNGGACCVSDSVYHSCCAYTTIANPNFQTSNCPTFCSDDDKCVGYSILTITYHIKDPIFLSSTYSVSACFLYTTSSCPNRDLGKNPIECHGMLNFSPDALDQDANCQYPEDAAGNFFVSQSVVSSCMPNPKCPFDCVQSCTNQPSSGCYIKNIGNTS